MAKKKIKVEEGNRAQYKNKAELAFKLFMEEPINGEFLKEKKKILLKAGYKETVANNPTHVTRTKTFQDLMDKYLPRKKVMKKHKELLSSSKDKVALAAVDMAYKLRGNYAPEKHANLNINMNAKDNPKVAIIAEKYEEEMREELANE